MPVITEPGDDAVVTAWFVDEGSLVAAEQLLAEVQAEKVAGDVRAPGAGIVRSLVGVNDPVPQGAGICTLFGEDEGEPPPAATAAGVPAGPRLIASPSAKRLAAELGLDLAAVTGTGPGGRITESDVRAAAGSGAAAASEMTGLRAVVARNMRRSVQETAPVTLTMSVDVTETVGPPITAWVVRAAAIAMGDHPQLNGTRDGDRFTPGEAAHVAVAIQTDDGLVAPVVRDVASSTVADVAQEIGRLAELARARGLTAADYEGATFTVTNLGALGVDGFTPIINLPQVAILGVGALRRVPGFDGTGAVVARQMLTLSLTFDHAFVDGAPAAEFLARVRDLLERGE
jgi:pyruvate/2-oxoglutarate dehydrogenase complex dihydrolipoamide acyltransferase (E2) component